MTLAKHRTPKVAASLSISYESEAFPASSRVGSAILNFSWDELLWAAITIGRPNTAFVFKHGLASLHEAFFRLSLVRMALEQTPSGTRLQRTTAFRGLDPTEKGAVSYFLGMAVCKLFASRLLGAGWLLHLDVFRDQLHPAVLGGRSRPDLVGRDASGAWHVFEAKGRSSAPSDEEKHKAKVQAQRLVSVDGVPCSLHIGSFAFFRQNELEFYWRDPEPEEPEVIEPIQLRVDDEDWAFYYAPALALAREDQFRLSQAAGIDVTVAVHPWVLEALSKAKWGMARERALQLHEVLKGEGYQPDGLRVIAGDSWRLPFQQVFGEEGAG